MQLNPMLLKASDVILFPNVELVMVFPSPPDNIY